MDVFKSDCYKLNTLLLAAIGAWPYTRNGLRRTQQTLTSLVLLFSICMQLGALGDIEYELNAVLRCVSYILIGLGLLVKFGSFLTAGITGVRVFELIKEDWQALKKPEELDIMRRYALKGKFHTILFAIMIYPASVGLALFPFGAVVLDIVFPLNQSRPLKFPTPLNMLFFDQKEHFWCAVPVLGVCTFVASTTFVATEAISIQCLQHACGLFEITSLRIRKAFGACATGKTSKQNSHSVLASGIQMHIRALEFCKFMKLNFTEPYLILLALGVSTLSIHLFCLSQILSGLENVAEGVSSLFLCISILGYMFYLNYMTQEVIDKSGDIFRDSYDCPWYDAPIAMQKLLVFIMLKSINVFTFDLFGIFNPSIEGFALISRMSVSYFMVLQSFQ